MMSREIDYKGVRTHNKKHPSLKYLVVVFVCLVMMPVAGLSIVVFKNDSKPIEKHNSILLNETDCPQSRYVLPRANQITDYIRLKTPMKQLSEVTICGWFSPDSSGYIQGTLFSYADEYYSNKLLLLGDAPNKTLESDANSIFQIQTASPTETTSDYHMCIYYSAFIEHSYVFINGILKYTFYVPGGVLSSGGILIIGQEQDNIGGGFDANQAYTGSVTNFMIWDRMLTFAEIQQMVASKCYCPAGHIQSLNIDEIELFGGAYADYVEEC